VAAAGFSASFCASTLSRTPGVRWVKGLLLDITKFGYVGVREPLALRVGYANDDFQRNILRFVDEERLTLCVTRPSAVCAITNLPRPQSR
jgi:hypothetical protein